MTDNECKRERTFEEELPHFKESVKEVFAQYHNPNGNEDPLYICVLRQGNRIVRKAEEKINRLRAEVDDLRRDDLPRCKGALRRANEIGMALEQENQELKAEIERLTDKLDAVIAGQETLQKHIVITKAEAIKEFLEKASGFVVVNVPVSLFKLEYGKDVELFSDVIRVKDLVRLYCEMERECRQVK